MKAVNEWLPLGLDGELDGSMTCQTPENRQMSGTTSISSKIVRPNPAGKS
jgi:hypothetical protein